MPLQANPLRELIISRPEQIVFDPFHEEGVGLGRHLLDILVRCLTPAARCV
jgi:hypothetical protein